MAPAVSAHRGELFDRVPDEVRAEITALGSTRDAGRGDVLIQQGALADAVTVLLSGRVKVVSGGANGKRLILEFRGPGSLLGEQAVLDRLPHSASITATERVEHLVIPASAFRAFLDRRHDVAATITTLLSERLRDSDRRRIEFASYSATELLAARLVELSMDHAEDIERREPVRVSITQEELAGWTATSIESVTRGLRALRAPGWIETGRGFLVVRDVDALLRLLG